MAGLFVTSGSLAFADGHDHDKDGDRDERHDTGHWRDKRKDHDDDNKDRRGNGFAEHDRDEIRTWYEANTQHLPPGLAKKDRLPPGIESQMVVNGKFPRGLEAKVYVVPVDLDRRLPPPPPDSERVVVSGHIVLRNRNTHIILDIFHLE